MDFNNVHQASKQVALTTAFHEIPTCAVSDAPGPLWVPPGIVVTGNTGDLLSGDPRIGFLGT